MAGPAEGRVLAFGPFTFDRASRLLSRDGAELAVPPRVLGVLALLLERPGILVTKQELMAGVWPDAFVTETSLAEAVSVLRQTLGDDPQRPTYIQTLHRRGYRFIAEVRDGADAPARPHAPLPAAPGHAPHAEPRLSLLVPWLIALFALLVAGAAVWQFLNAAPATRSAARFTIALPDGVVIARSGAPIAVSHDGATVAFTGCRESRCAIYLRPLAQADATPVAGTAGGSSPFFSPDDRWLGFFASGRLHKIALAGGAPVTLATAAEPFGATWTSGGEIVFADSTSGGLAIVPDTGGGPRRLTTPIPGEGGHRWPDALADGSAVVFTVAGTQAGADDMYAAAASLRTRGQWGRLMDGAAGVRAPVPGYLLAQRDREIIGVGFDPRTLSVNGLPVPVAPGAAAADAPAFALSGAGTLVLAAPGAHAIDVMLEWQHELRRLVPAPQPALPR